MARRPPDRSEWLGYWWLAAAPDHVVPGRLWRSDDGGYQLDVIGGLDLPIGDRRPLSVADTEHDESYTIFGIVDGESRVTLDYCFLGLQVGPRGVRAQRQQVIVQKVFIGTHVSTGDAVFSEAIIRIENLTTWLGDSNSATSDSGGEAATANINDLPIIECVVDGWRIQSRGLAQPFDVRDEHDRRVIESEIGGYLVLEPPKPQPERAFASLIHELTDLLTLASGEASGLIGLTLIRKDRHEVHPPGKEPYSYSIRVEVLGRRIHIARPAAPAISWHAFRFTCDDVPFSDIVPAWLALRRNAPQACDVFFGMRYARPVFTEVRVLLTAATAETLHQRLFGDVTELPQARYREIKNRLLTSLDDEEDRRWLRDALHNSPSFTQRMRALAAQLPEAVVAMVLPDAEKWVRELRDARNSLAHSGTHDTEELHRLEWRTSAIVTLTLLQQLGLDETLLARAVKRMEWTASW